MPDYLLGYYGGSSPDPTIKAQIQSGLGALANNHFATVLNYNAHRNGRASDPPDWGLGIAVGRFLDTNLGYLQTEIQYGLTLPVWVTPVFSVSAFVSLALPLFIVTMASQNLPGVAAIKAAGFGELCLTEIVGYETAGTKLRRRRGARWS